MNNINQKNVIQTLNSNAQVPYLCADFISLYDVCENTNVAEMNNIAQQLLDNYLYLEAALNDASAYSIGPKIYDESTIAQMPNGYKVFGNIKTSNCLDILRKVDDPLSSTLKKVVSTGSASFLCQYGSKIFSSVGGKLMCSEDPSSKEFYEVKTNTGNSIAAKNWYIDNDNLFFCTSNNAYQLSTVYDVGDDGKTMVEKMAGVQLLKSNVDTSKFGTVDSIAVNSSRRSIALGTSDSKVLAGKYPSNIDLESIANSISLSAQQVQISDGSKKAVLAMHYFPNRKADLYLGVENGLYQEQLSAGLEGQVLVSSPTAESIFNKVKWFNNALYAGTSTGLYKLINADSLIWEQVKRPNGQNINENVVGITTTRTAMYVATTSKVFKITATYITEQTVNVANTLLNGKTFSTLATINDEIVFVGTADCKVFYYTQNDIIYPKQLELPSGATGSIVGIVATDQFISVATPSNIYCFEVQKMDLAQTNIVKAKTQHSTGGNSLDSEIRKIFNIYNKTFIVTSRKIFSTDGKFCWNSGSVMINDVEVFQHESNWIIAIAGHTKSFVMHVSEGGDSYSITEVTLEDVSIPAVDVAATDDILVFIDTSSLATVIDLSKELRHQTPSQTSLGGSFKQLESAGEIIYGQNDDGHKIQKIMKYLPSLSSNIGKSKITNAFVADEQANVGFVAFDSGISCISAKYSQASDGDEIIDLTASWVPKATKSILLTNLDQYNDVVLLGTSNGICSAFLDDVAGDLESIKTKLNSATKINGSPNNATNIVETTQNGIKKIFAITSADNKIYSQTTKWSNGENVAEFGPQLQSFISSIYFSSDDDDDEKTQYIYSTNLKTEFKRGSTTSTIDNSRSATKICDNPLGLYMKFSDGSLGFWFDENTINSGTGLPQQQQIYYPQILNGIVDIACYQYFSPYLVDTDTNYLGLQFALASGNLYRINAVDLAGSTVTYRAKADVEAVSLKTFTNAVNCDIVADDSGDQTGLILVAQANGTIYIGELNPTGELNFNWKSTSVSGGIKGAWFVSDGKIAVWTETEALKVFSLSKNASGNYVLSNGKVKYNSIKKVSKASSTITTYNLFGEVDGDIVEAYTKATIVEDASGWSGYSFLLDDKTQTYAFSITGGTFKYTIRAGDFSRIYTGIKYLDSLSDGTTSLMIGITSGGKLAYNTDGTCTSWTEFPISESNLIGCRGSIVGDQVRIFTWTSSVGGTQKVYYGETQIDRLNDLDLGEYLDSKIHLGTSIVRGFADSSVQTFKDANSGKNEIANFCTGDYNYNNQIILTNNGILYFDGTPSVRVTEVALEKTNWMVKDSLGRIWVIGHSSNASQPNRVFSQMSGTSAKLSTTSTITSLQIFIDQKDNIASVSFSDGNVKLGQINMATDMITLSEASIPGISKITAIGKDEETVVFGTSSSTGAIILYEFEYFIIHNLKVDSNSITETFTGLSIKQLMQYGNSASFNVIYKKLDDETIHLLEYHPNQDKTKSTEERQFTERVGGVQFQRQLRWLCQLDDDGDQMVLALQLDDDTDTLNYTYYNELQEYENVCISNPRGFAKVGSKYAIVTGEKLVIFDKHGILTTYVKISSSNKAYRRFLEQDDSLLVTATDHLESVDKTSIPVVMKAGLTGLRTIATATFDDGKQRWFYIQKNAGKQEVWQSTNCRIWKKMFELKDTSIGTVYDVVPINKNIFVFATDKGIYSTCYSWTMVPDVNDFTRDDALELYEHAKQIYMTPTLETQMSKHDLEHHGIASGDDQEVSQQPLIAQLNSRFSSVDLDDLEPTWQKQAKNDSAGTLGITNDLIAEMQFGSYIDGDILVYTSSFVNACEYTDQNLEDEMKEVTNISFIMKRWMSGVTDLYINVPTTSSYYLNNLYGASGCRMQPEASIERQGKVGSCGPTTGELSSHYTSLVVGIASAEYHVDQMLGIEINGNSLPLEIYKDSTGNAGPSKNLYSSYIEPSVARSWNTTTTDTEGNWLFNFACFGTDAQAIHLMFYDSKARANAPYIKIVFDSNGGEGEMAKQKFLLIGEDPTKYTLEQKTLRKNRFKNDSIGYDKIFAGWSLSPQPDNYSGGDALDGTQVYENTQVFPTSVGFEELMQELGRGSGSGVEGLVKKEEITLYAVWLTYRFSETDTRLVMNSTKEPFKIGEVGVDESTNLRGTVVIDFGD